MNRYVLSRAARSDLDAIWSYLAEGSTDAADRWIDRLLSEFELLAASG